MKKKNHHCRPGSKRFAECHDAALRIIDMRDDDITPETIYWRALYERCKRFSAEAEDPVDHLRMHGVGGIKEIETGKLPARVGKILGRG